MGQYDFDPSTMATQTATAIVSSGPENVEGYTPGSNWSYQTIGVPNEPGEGELLVGDASILASVQEDYKTKKTFSCSR